MTQATCAQPKPVTAWSRLETFFDPGSIEPIRAEVRSPVVAGPPGDGIAAAIGRVDGRPVLAYSQDKTTFGGSLGIAHAGTIVRLLEAADRFGHPVVGFIDSAGARLQEGTDALAGYGAIFRRQVALSGRVFQAAVISGAAAGGGAYSPALMDLVVMTGAARMFLTGPAVVREAVGEDLTAAELGGPQVHARNGVAHHVAETDEDAGAFVRRMIDLIHKPEADGDQDAYSARPEFELIVPRDPRKVYDVRDVARVIADPDTWIETQPRWARNLVTGFCRIGRRSAGVIANQPKWLGGVLDAESAAKGARFVRMCNCFGLPIVTLVDTPGFMPGSAQEHAGVIRHGAKLLHAFAEATVPRPTVVLRKAYGGALIAMNSKELGADLVLAWPGAELGVMSAVSAVRMTKRHELMAAGDQEGELLDRFSAEYRSEHLTAARAAERGHVDGLLEPSQTRARLARALETMSSNEEARRAGNIPL